MVPTTQKKMAKDKITKEKKIIRQSKISDGIKESTAKPIRRKARVERLLKSREPQIIEDTKRILILKGHKTSETSRDALMNINLLSKPHSKNFTRKNEILPFEDITSMEFLCEKNQCALFCLGTHTKKRPDNLIFGRMFDGHLLDMYEFGVGELFQPIENFDANNKKRMGSKPVIVFNGDQWESDSTFKKIGNLL